MTTFANRYCFLSLKFYKIFYELINVGWLLRYYELIFSHITDITKMKN